MKETTLSMCIVFIAFASSAIFTKDKTLFICANIWAVGIILFSTMKISAGAAE